MEKLVKVCTAFFKNLTLSSYLGTIACTIFLAILKVTIWESLSWWIVFFPMYLPFLVILVAGTVAAVSILGQKIMRASGDLPEIKCPDCNENFTECKCPCETITEVTVEKEPVEEKPLEDNSKGKEQVVVEPKVVTVKKAPKKKKKAVENITEVKPAVEVSVEPAPKKQTKKKKANGGQSTKESTKSTNSSK